MEIISQNKWSSLGALFGAIALLMGIFHFSMGPFSTPPPLETVVAEKVSAVKKGILAGLKGEKPAAAPAQPKPVDVDKVIDNLGIALAVAALLCAFIAGMRKENRWSISGALAFGGGTLVFHALLFGIAVICAIIVLFLIVSFLTGGGL